MPQAERANTEEILGNIPEELRRRPQWIVHKDKIPHIAGGVGRADTTDLMTWRTFEEAVQALESGRYDGVGFVFSSGDPFAGVDLDKCRDPETGELEDWAAEIVASFGGYFGGDPPSQVFVFTKGDWIAGVVGLDRDQADAAARPLAARL